MGELGGVYYEMDSLHLAKKILLTVTSNTEERRCSHLLPYLGYIYEKESALDSAYLCYQKVLRYGNVQQRYYAYQNLFNMSRAQGRQAEANEYIKEALTLKNLLEKNKQTETIAKVNSLYNYQHTEQKYQTLQMKQAQHKRWLTGLAFSTLLLAIACMLFMYHAKKKQHREEQHPLQHTTAEPLVSPQETSDTSSQDTQPSQEELVKELRASEVYERFYWAANDSSIKITHDDWLELQQKINIAYPDFTKRLKDLNPNLSVQAIQISCLIKISMPSASIARIIGRSRSTISLACCRYYEKIHHTKGDAEKFRKFIENL